MLNKSLFVTALLLLVACVCCKKERNVPHQHSGLLKPYQAGPFALSMTAKDEERLANGKPVMKQSDKGKEEGGAICVQDVEAPKAAVWNQILRMDDYKGKVAKVIECKNYFVKRNDDGDMTIKTKQRLGVLPGYTYENYYDHTYFPSKDSLTWTLDYDKNSDFDDVAGSWYVTDHPKKPGCTRVFYACDIKFRHSPPKPVLSYLSKSALKTATAWVKKNSEKEPENGIPEGYEPADAPELAGASPRGGGGGWGLKKQ